MLWLNLKYVNQEFAIKIMVVYIAVHEQTFIISM